MPSSGKTTAFRNLGPETVMYNTERKMLLEILLLSTLPVTLFVKKGASR
jgi:hypothetical protein